MNREITCGRGEALSRTDVAERYLTVAELAAEDDAHASRNVAVGNAVLAGIAASDALCCLRLGRRSRGQDHHAAVDLVRHVDATLARDLDRLLRLKDTAHYGDQFISSDKVISSVRAAQRLVEAAREATRT
ncbi:MAG TPA: hypothetical protein VFD41_03775 [Actinomycetales bacterium]|nr:hypothetical protein [Actinomycetales bacterium]